MKSNYRGKKNYENSFENQSHFLQDLQQSLIQQGNTFSTGINQFQKLYQKKKMLSQTIDQYQQKNAYIKSDILRAKQRISQISQLNDKANKQSVLMRNQISKINDVHMISKILMMQKIVRLGLENQNLQRKRQKCNEIRQQKQRVTDIGRSLFTKKQRKRQLSVMESKAHQSYIQETNYQTLEENRCRADRIRSQKQRRRERFQRYQQFKLQQAKSNYMSKTQSLHKNLQQKQKLLQTLVLKQIKQKKHFQTTQNVTKQYVQKLYMTAANSHQSSLFPTIFN